LVTQNYNGLHPLQLEQGRLMHTHVSPDQRLQLNAALAVIQWKHAFAVRMQQRANAKPDNQISGPRVPSLANKKLLSKP
jgi:hypothetical protein